MVQGRRTEASGEDVPKLYRIYIDFAVVSKVHGTIQVFEYSLMIQVGCKWIF